MHRSRSRSPIIMFYVAAFRSRSRVTDAIETSYALVCLCRALIVLCSYSMPAGGTFRFHGTVWQVVATHGIITVDDGPQRLADRAESQRILESIRDRAAAMRARSQLLQIWARRNRRTRELRVPAAAILLIALLPGIYFGVLGYRLWRRSATGLCVACGYDLRGTPGRCAECGLTDQRLRAAGPPLVIAGGCSALLWLLAFSLSTASYVRAPRILSSTSAAAPTTRPAGPIELPASHLNWDDTWHRPYTAESR